MLDHYAAGGRTVVGAGFTSVGRLNPFKNQFVVGFQLAAKERAGLLAFLEILTHEAFITNPRFSDPWPRPSAR